MGASLALLIIFSAPSAPQGWASGTVSEGKGFNMSCDSGTGRTPHVADVFSGLQSSRLLHLCDIHCRKTFLLFLPSCLLTDLGFSGTTRLRS